MTHLRTKLRIHGARCVFPVVPFLRSNRGRQNDEVKMASDFLEKLVEDGVISRDQLAEAQQMAANVGITTEEALVKLE